MTSQIVFILINIIIIVVIIIIIITIISINININPPFSLPKLLNCMLKSSASMLARFKSPFTA